MKQKNYLTKKTRYHMLIGGLLGLWIFIFLVLIGPFDIAPLSIQDRWGMMSGYGIIFSLSYLLVIPLQNYLVKQFQKEDYRLELFVVFFIFTFTFFPTYLYYKSDFIRGDYPFFAFLLQIYLPIIALVLPILVILRGLISKATKNAEKMITLGKGKYDQVRLRFADVVFVKGADNYVEIHYLENQELKLKLIRGTLKEVKQKAPELVQTHRSFLMNAAHFVSWNTKNSISLTRSQIPVSDTYRKKIHPI